MAPPISIKVDIDHTNVVRTISDIRKASLDAYTPLKKTADLLDGFSHFDKLVAETSKIASQESQSNIQLASSSKVFGPITKVASDIAKSVVSSAGTTQTEVSKLVKLSKDLDVPAERLDILRLVFKKAGIEASNFQNFMYSLNGAMLKSDNGASALDVTLKEFGKELGLAGKDAKDVIAVLLRLSAIVKSEGSEFNQRKILSAALGDKHGLSLNLMSQGPVKIKSDMDFVRKQGAYLDQKTINEYDKISQKSVVNDAKLDASLAQISVYPAKVGAAVKDTAAALASDIAKGLKYLEENFADRRTWLEKHDVSSGLSGLMVRDVMSKYHTVIEEQAAFETSLKDGDPLSVPMPIKFDIPADHEDQQQRLVRSQSELTGAVREFIENSNKINSDMGSVLDFVTKISEKTGLDLPGLLEGTVLESRLRKDAAQGGGAIPSTGGGTAVPHVSVPPTSVPSMPRDCCEELKALLEKFVPGGGKAGDGKPVHGSAGDDVLPDRAAFDKVLKEERTRTNQVEATADAYGEQARQADALGDIVAATNNDLVQQTDIGDTILESNQDLLEVELARTAEQKTQLDQLDKFGDGVKTLTEQTLDFGDKLGAAITDPLKAGVDQTRALIHDTLTALFEGNLKKAKGFWKAFVDIGKNTLKNLASSVIQSLVSSITNGASRLLGNLFSGGGTGSGGIGGFFSSLFGGGQRTSGPSIGFGDILSIGKSFFGSFGSTVTSALTSFGTSLGSFGTTLGLTASAPAVGITSAGTLASTTGGALTTATPPISWRRRLC